MNEIECQLILMIVFDNICMHLSLFLSGLSYLFQGKGITLAWSENWLKIGKALGFALCVSIGQRCPRLLSYLGKKTCDCSRSSSLTALLMNPPNCNYLASLTWPLPLAQWYCSLQCHCCKHTRKYQKCCKIQFSSYFILQR